MQTNGERSSQTEGVSTKIQEAYWVKILKYSIEAVV
jgi:hypothetical protein